MKRVLVIGATSAIARETARRFAEAGAAMFLVARSEERLRDLRADLEVRGASGVGTYVMDVTEFERHESVISEALRTMDGIDVALLAHGSLPDQKACEDSPNHALRCFEVNLLSVISLVTLLANVFERQRKGTIAVISSVAGDRGRQSNYAYGSAKGALSIFLQGVRNRLHASGVHVLTVKPGLVDSPMTAGFEKSVLWSRPEQVAAGIVKAIARKRDVVYLPWYWRWIMVLVRLIPERVFKRMPL